MIQIDLKLGELELEVLQNGVYCTVHKAEMVVVEHDRNVFVHSSKAVFNSRLKSSNRSKELLVGGRSSNFLDVRTHQLAHKLEFALVARRGWNLNLKNAALVNLNLFLLEPDHESLCLKAVRVFLNIRRSPLGFLLSLPLEVVVGSGQLALVNDVEFQKVKSLLVEVDVFEGFNVHEVLISSFEHEQLTQI